MAAPALRPRPWFCCVPSSRPHLLTAPDVMIKDPEGTLCQGADRVAGPRQPAAEPPSAPKRQTCGMMPDVSRRVVDTLEMCPAHHAAPTRREFVQFVSFEPVSSSINQMTTPTTAPISGKMMTPRLLQRSVCESAQRVRGCAPG